MTDEEIIRDLVRLRNIQEKLITELGKKARTLFEQDKGMIDRAFKYGCALDAVKHGLFDTAVDHMVAE